MAYTPAPGTAVNLVLDGLSQPIVGVADLTLVDASLGDVFPSGEAVDLNLDRPSVPSSPPVELVLGDYVLGNLYPAGLHTALFGAHYVLDPRVWPVGVDTAGYGAPVVVEPYARPIGVDTAGYGEPRLVKVPTRQSVSFSTSGSGPNTLVTGTQFCAYFLRFVEVPGTLGGAYGLGAVGYRVRHVSTVSTSSQSQFGDAFVSPAVVWSAAGVDQTQYGTASLAFGNTIFSRLGDVGAQGVPMVAYRNRELGVEGELYELFGDQIAYVGTQLLYQYHEATSLAADAAYGVWLEVANRNKSLGPIGLHSLSISSTPADVVHGGRAISASGVPPAGSGTALVAYSVRQITPQGIAQDQYPDEFFAYCLARTIAVPGHTPGGTGTPAVDRLLKFSEQYGSRHEEFGTPWTSHAIRSVYMVALDGYSQNNDHYVSHWPLLAQVLGVSTEKFGDQFVYAKPPVVVYPSWHQSWVLDQINIGTPAVRRYPPIIEVEGRPFTEFPWQSPWVSFRVRTVTSIVGATSDSIGRHTVMDRKQTVRVEGSTTSAISPAFRVANVIDSSTLPSTRYVYLRGTDNQLKFGDLSLFTSYVYPDSQWAVTFGDLVVRSNVVEFLPKHHASMLGMTTFGAPRIPGVQTVTVGGVYVGEMQDKVHVVSPFHVYCTRRMPEKYRDNLSYLSTSWPASDVGESITTHPPSDLGCRYGELRVLPSPHVQYAPAYHPNAPLSAYTEYGDHWVVNKTPQVFLVGMSTMRAGFPGLLPRAQSIRCSGVPTMRCGAPEVSTPPSALAVLVSGRSGTLGAIEVQNQHRTVYQGGSRHDVYGANNPMVSFPRTINPSFDATAFGIQWVSNWHREVHPAWPEDAEEYNGADQYEGRPTVRRAQLTVRAIGGWEFASGDISVVRWNEVHPYSVPLLCPTSRFTQVLHV